MCVVLYKDDSGVYMLYKLKFDFIFVIKNMIDFFFVVSFWFLFICWWGFLWVMLLLRMYNLKEVGWGRVEVNNLYEINVND